jgi:hypothetical protein
MECATPINRSLLRLLVDFLQAERRGMPNHSDDVVEVNFTSNATKSRRYLRGDSKQRRC